MPDYAKYRAALNISNNDMVGALKGVYPGFSKIQCSMVNNPGKYGLCLTADAERHLVEKLGYAEGLGIKKKKPQVKRTKTNQLSVRLSDESYDKVKAKMQQTGCGSVQDYLEKVITESVKET